jgi:hypothetical protein
LDFTDSLLLEDIMNNGRKKVFYLFSGIFVIFVMVLLPGEVFSKKKLKSKKFPRPDPRPSRRPEPFIRKERFWSSSKAASACLPLKALLPDTPCL